MPEEGLEPSTSTTTDAAVELERLLARRHELVETAAEAERRSRFASTDLLDAQGAVEQAERARLSGQGTDQQVKTAERQLQKARELAAVPWPQRAVGARSAIRDAERDISTFVAEHYDQLSAQHNEQAQHAADALDAALRAVLDATREREELAERAASLWRWVGHPRPDLTPRSRLVQPEGKLAQEIEAVLMRGGERPPTMPASYLPEHADVAPPAEAEADVVVGPMRVRFE